MNYTRTRSHTVHLMTRAYVMCTHVFLSYEETWTRVCCPCMQTVNVYLGHTCIRRYCIARLNRPRFGFSVVNNFTVKSAFVSKGFQPTLRNLPQMIINFALVVIGEGITIGSVFLFVSTTIDPIYYIIFVHELGSTLRWDLLKDDPNRKADLNFMQFRNLRFSDYLSASIPP